MKKTHSIIAFFVILNLFLCLGLIYTSQKYNRLTRNYKEALVIIEELKRQKKSQWYSYYSINEDMLYSEMLNLGIYEYIRSPHYYLTIFIPPGFCGVCLDSVCETIVEMEKENNDPVVILVPSFKYRDIYARFSNYNAITSIEYNYESLLNQNLAQTDRIVLFRMGKDRIKNIIFADKENPEWIREYLIK